MEGDKGQRHLKKHLSLDSRVLVFFCFFGNKLEAHFDVIKMPGEEKMKGKTARFIC
jgi:hypothetical protein